MKSQHTVKKQKYACHLKKHLSYDCPVRASEPTSVCVYIYKIHARGEDIYETIFTIVIWRPFQTEKPIT